MRSLQLLTNGYYHVYNRGVDKRLIFHRFGHYLHFTNAIRRILNTGSATERPIYNQGQALKLKVEILAYCLMPNHYHFLIKQTQDNGITEFMQKLDTSYTMYFNLNNHRTGHLFEYAFKAKTAETDEMLLHISRYIHLNPVIGHLVEYPHEWKWSSFREYFENEPCPIIQPQHILSFFSSTNEYKNFINDQIAYAMLLKESSELKDEDSFFL